MFITTACMAPVLRRGQDRSAGQGFARHFDVHRRKGTAGFSVGRSLKKHGWRSSDTAELFFDNVRIPASQLLGEENKGFYAS